MKRRDLTIPAALCLLAILWGPAPAGQVAIVGVGPNLIISTATAGQEPDPVIDESCGLRYSKGAGEPTMKVTARTNHAGPQFDLQVEAFNAENGNPTGVVNLSTTSQDLITDVTAVSNKSCDLRYRAVSATSDGTGSETHTVTYTIVAQ